MPDWLPPAALLLVAAAATYVSRGLGVMLAGRIDPAGPLFAWVGLVTYALLAGLIARMILLPIGALQETTLLARLAATALAAGVFFATRRNLLLGVASGSILLALLSA
ncbi:MAG TPA: AzlD domain-containing protein [Alphaproteobacteria bacterium]|nr:AzlD domain-containing protein [Alphaproteobacteria bacterium]